MQAMDVSVSRLEGVVISHDHWDHTGGLEEILWKNRGISVYGCPGFSEEFSRKVEDLGGQLMVSKGFSGITDNIFVTGPMRGIHGEQEIEEQSLVLNTSKGVAVITGCAHPGIANITEEAKKRSAGKELYCVIGGFHLSGQKEKDVMRVVARMRDLGVRKIGPAHCTGKEAAGIFKKAFRDDFIPVAAGEQWEV